MKCPICKAQKTSIFLRRYKVPVCQNLLCFSKQSAKSIRRDDIYMSVCKKCGFIFNKCFDETLLRYGKNYNNNQTSSPIFREHISGLINLLINKEGVHNKSIVEIGCGDGFFLKILCRNGKNTGIGFDPSYAGPENIMNGRVKFIRDYYGENNKAVGGDIIVCRHVIEHVQYPLHMLNLIKRTCKVSFPHVKIFFETPSAAWILKNCVIWDFFYEHCSYFTAQSLRTAFEISGFKVNNISNMFGGQYLWLSAEIERRKPAQKDKLRASNIQKSTNKFSVSEKRLLKNYRHSIEKMAREGNVALWGAGAKGVTLANLIDTDSKLINSVVDLNPKKQGCYIPGTGHSIIDYRQLSKRGVKNVILMNPNYRSENKSLLRKANLHNVNLV